MGSGASPYETLCDIIASWLETQATAIEAAGRTIEIPVCYGNAFGPDLDAVARSVGLSSGEVIAIHSGSTYYVHMLGFVIRGKKSPGFGLQGLTPLL